jgi:hypothetical protein
MRVRRRSAGLGRESTAEREDREQQKLRQAGAKAHSPEDLSGTGRGFIHYIRLTENCAPASHASCHHFGEKEAHSHLLNVGTDPGISELRPRAD